jgi:HSP20 family molecular chaperone IbpA
MEDAMTENTENPKASGEHKLLRWILVLQIVILAWLAKNHFDGAFNRRFHNPPAVATLTDTPPSLEPSAPNAPSSIFSPFAVFQQVPPQRFAHPADRMREEMERMMAQANRAFADSDSPFGSDAAWAALPASPAMNMREMGDAYELTLALPNTDPGSLDVKLDGRLLSVSSRQGTRTANSASSQSFSTRLLLPGPVDPNTPVQITNENNRICIRIPKPVAATASRTKP